MSFLTLVTPVRLPINDKNTRYKNHLGSVVQVSLKTGGRGRVSREVSCGGKRNLSEERQHSMKGRESGGRRDGTRDSRRLYSFC